MMLDSAADNLNSAATDNLISAATDNLVPDNDAGFSSW